MKAVKAFLSGAAVLIPLRHAVYDVANFGLPSRAGIGWTVRMNNISIDRNISEVAQRLSACATALQLHRADHV